MLRVTLNWQGPADLDLYLTNANCTVATDCVIYDFSAAETGSSELVARAVLKGEALKVWVDNFEAARVDYSLQVVVEQLQGNPDSVSQAELGQRSRPGRGASWRPAAV